MSNDWTDKKMRSICNFLVNSPKGTILLTFIDTLDISKTAIKVFEMIDDIVKQVGEENIVQIVTDNAANYKAAGEMLMEKHNKLFWTPPAAHCIDLMLEDLEKKIKVHELTIMKDSDDKPAMGFIYNEMEKAKQKIKANFKDDRKSYAHIWKVIDERWEIQLHRPLHAAAYYLNPQLHFSFEFRANREVMRGLYKVMDRMLDDEERDKIDLQLEEFKHERGLFGFSSTKSMRFKKTPIDWWESYGADTLELQKI
ncbi:uncharacterized protein LOC116205419 [Punica granatum]|uniref:Uncharacterized protein LOC116205419 n=1 Tax=Punica granatum TaxID=22663 RepID=A0A6P8DKG2_PUNGR|nr:uncharacterized protein LOC116205419 [Punica granatum]